MKSNTGAAAFRWRNTNSPAGTTVVRSRARRAASGPGDRLMRTTPNAGQTRRWRSVGARHSREHGSCSSPSRSRTTRSCGGVSGCTAATSSRLRRTTRTPTPSPRGHPVNDALSAGQTVQRSWPSNPLDCAPSHLNQRNRHLRRPRRSRHEPSSNGALRPWRRRTNAFARSSAAESGPAPRSTDLQRPMALFAAHDSDADMAPGPRVSQESRTASRYFCTGSNSPYGTYCGISLWATQASSANSSVSATWAVPPTTSQVAYDISRPVFG